MSKVESKKVEGTPVDPPPQATGGDSNVVKQVTTPGDRTVQGLADSLPQALLGECKQRSALTYETHQPRHVPHHCWGSDDPHG